MLLFYKVKQVIYFHLASMFMWKEKRPVDIDSQQVTQDHQNWSQKKINKFSREGNITWENSKMQEAHCSSLHLKFL